MLPSLHPSPSPAPLSGDELIALLAETLTVDWLPVERLLDRIEAQEGRT